MKLDRRRFIGAGAAGVAAGSWSSAGALSSPEHGAGVIGGRMPVVAVIGHGTAGVVAGSLLQEAGARVTLFELAGGPCEDLAAFESLPGLCDVDRRVLTRAGWGTTRRHGTPALADDAGDRIHLNRLRPALLARWRALPRRQVPGLQLHAAAHAIRIAAADGRPIGAADAAILAVPAVVLPRLLRDALPWLDPTHPFVHRLAPRRHVQVDARVTVPGAPVREQRFGIGGGEAAWLDSVSHAEAATYLRHRLSRQLDVAAQRIDVVRQQSLVRRVWPADLGFERGDVPAPIPPPEWRGADPRLVVCGLHAATADGLEGLISAGTAAAEVVLRRRG